MSTGIGIGIAGDTFQTRAGLASGGSAPLLLDEYGADVKIAYSVRKLRTAYTGDCMRVRNGSSVELDIGFDSSGNLDESALLTHCGSGDGFVTIWYDQTGNNGYLQQPTDTLQSKIVSSGSVLKANGNPIIIGQNAVYATKMDLVTPKSTYLPSTGQYFFFSVCKANTPRCILYNENTSTNWQFAAQEGSTSTVIAASNYASDTYRRNGAAYTPSTRDDLYNDNIAQSLLTIDGNLTTSIPAFRIGHGASNFDLWDMQEFIVYEGDKSSDESNIETAINGHYSIY